MLLRKFHPRLFAVVGVVLFFAVQSVSAQSLPDFTALVEKYSPSVVNISTKQTSSRSPLPKNFKIPELPEGSPWNDLFKHFFGQEGEAEEREARSLGSGFVIDTNGYILTNNHVVEDADEILVRLNDRRELKAKLIGADSSSDLALLKVDATDLPVVEMGRSSDLKVGEWVMAIGSPFGFEASVSVGVVSALGRNLPSENYVPFIQTDVAINPGNSGGPLFNLDGEVVGINSQIYSRTGGFMGLSFAIPIDVAMDVVKQLKNKGYVSRGWLGVLIQDVTRELAESFGMDKPHGALVAQVVEGSPAAKGGLQVGDIITDFNGQEINYSSDLPPMVGRVQPGDKASVKVLRDGRSKTLKLKIGELKKDDEVKPAGSKPEKSTINKLGLAVYDVPDELREMSGIDKGGVVVEEAASGPAADAGIQVGDVIVKINGVTIKGASHFEELVNSLPKGRSVPVLIKRSSGPLFLALKVPKE